MYAYDVFRLRRDSVIMRRGTLEEFALRFYLKESAIYLTSS
jgi:hypothetical protein